MANGVRIRIVSWNVHRCFGTDGAYRPERVADALREFGADIIALQEVDSSLHAPDGRDQLSYIESSLGMDSVMGPTLARDYGAYGNALLARLPILSFESHDLSFRKFEPRGALSVELDAGGTSLRILNTHLGLKYWERAFQIDRVLGSLIWGEGTKALTILLGDFNEWFPFSGNALRLARAFHHPPRLATFPSAWPRFALDRIYFSKKIVGVSYFVPRNPLARIASDHLPLIAEFPWPFR